MKNLVVAFSICCVGLSLVGCKNDKPNPSNAETKASVVDSLKGGNELPNTWKDVPCTLITDEEVAAVYGPKFTTTNYRVNTVPEGTLCLRQWDHPDFEARKVAYEQGSTVSPRSSLNVQFVYYGTERDANYHFKRFRDEVSPTNPSTIAVSGVGDEAIWSDDVSTLTFRRGPYIFSVMTDVEAQIRDNLPITQQLATVMMKKIDAQLNKAL